MTAVPDDWILQLASALAAAIREFPRLLEGESITFLDIGCFPWHGGFELSALTAAELAADPAAMEPREVASWRFYNASAGLAAWAATEDLGKQMSDAYYAAEDGSRGAIAKRFMQACAAAAAVPEVATAVGLLPRDPRFRVRVVHPDSGREFEIPAA